MNKKQLRLKYKELRNQLSKDEIDKKSVAIANQLLQLDIWDKMYYHVFLTSTKKNEVETKPIIKILQSRNKKIVVSKSDFDTYIMKHFLLNDATLVIENKFKIPEPQNGIEVLDDKIEVVFVPLLAFDIFGNRVGFGKGFYDIFLSKCTPETIKIGLSFFEAEQFIEDVFETDIKLDYCITPLQVYKF